MKKKRLLWIFPAVVLAAALTTSVYAYMIHRSQTIANRFIPAQVTCTAHEVFGKNAETNKDEKTSITIENTGNIDAYLRVRLVFHWQDDKNHPVARNMTPPVVEYDSENWVWDGEFTYYYKQPVTPDGFTENLLASGKKITMESVTESGWYGTYTYCPTLEIVAEAIQSLPTTTVTAQWGVMLDANGMIQSVLENSDN